MAVEFHSIQETFVFPGMLPHMERRRKRNWEQLHSQFRNSRELVFVNKPEFMVVRISEGCTSKRILRAIEAMILAAIAEDE